MPPTDGDDAKYANSYSPENLYGHVVELLRRQSSADNLKSLGAVHLDVACGYAAIAEVIQAELGLHYVGVDIDHAAVAAVKARGLEATSVDLNQAEDRILTALDLVLAGRRVASITVLDGIEHLTDAAPLLCAIRTILLRDAAVLVVSVPNVTHRDVGYKLAIGEWAYTPSGLLDTTHVRLFGEAELTVLLNGSGLHVVAKNDFELSNSDQHYPAGHPMLMPGTTLNRFMNNLRDGAEPNGRVNQFVWACLPGPIFSSVHQASPPESDHFLSVIMRTQGQRIPEMVEALLCLTSQSSQDFEIIVVAHNVDIQAQIEIERAIEGMPGSLRGRCRLVRVDYGTRATLLNVAFQHARGRYVTALDDDDLVFAHWVETFQSLEKSYPGQVLRSVCVRQMNDRVGVLGQDAIRAVDGCQMIYDREFSFVAHLSGNRTPFMSVAFPRGLFRDLGLRFDETLTTTEDWDYLLRAASMVGVADSKEITAIYRGWVAQASSRTVHHEHEWTLNQYSVDRKVDAQPILLPKGETRRIRELVRESEGRVDRVLAENDPDREGLQHRLVSLIESNSWRVTAPPRALSAVLGRGRSVKASNVVLLPNENIRAAIADIERSRSWQLTRFFRRH